jgi:hypothetical protein
MMSAGRDNFQRAFGGFLSLDVTQIEQIGLAFLDLRGGARQHLRAFEVVGDLDQRICGNDLDIGARPCRFRPASRWTDQAFVARIGAYRRRQHAGHRRDRTIDPARLQEPTVRSSAIPQDADERLDFIFPSVAWATDTPSIAVP